MSDKISVRGAQAIKGLAATLSGIGILVALAYGLDVGSWARLSVIAPSFAEDDHGGHSSGHGKGGGGSGGGHGGSGKGSHSTHGSTADELEELLRHGGHRGHDAAAGEDEEGESDRPIWAQGRRDLNPHAKGGHEDDMVGNEAEAESDRPVWAGGHRELNPHSQGGGQPGSAGSKKGDLYGDLYVVLRDVNGAPILKTLPSGEQVVQPIDANGNVIPLNDEGEPANSDAAALLQPVEFSRLSVARAPDKVLEKSLADALNTLSSIYALDSGRNIVVASGASINFDAAGRLVVTANGSSQTIDSPLANLALYTDLMKRGSLSTIVTLSYQDASNQTIFVSKEVSFVPDRNLGVAASLLAAAADKTGTVSVDLVAYENSILGVNTVVDGATAAFFDYSTYSYDRATSYAGKTIKYLEPTTDAAGATTYMVVEKPILDAVFGGTDGVFQKSTDNLTAGNITGFAASSNDALQVIEFVHDHQIPES